MIKLKDLQRFLSLIVYGCLTLLAILVSIYSLNSHLNQTIPNTLVDPLFMSALSFSIGLAWIVQGCLRKDIISNFLMILIFFLLLYCGLNWGATLPATLGLFALGCTLSGVLFSSKRAFTTIVVLSSLLMMIYLLNQISSGPNLLNFHSQHVFLPDLVTYIVLFAILGLITYFLSMLFSIQSGIFERELFTIQSSSMEYVRLAGIGKVFSDLVHLLVNPVAALSLWSENVNNPKVIVQSVKQLSKTLRVVRDQTHLSNKSSLFKVRDVARNVIDLHKYLNIGKHISFSIDSVHNVQLFGDRESFQAAVSILVDNAADACVAKQNGNKEIRFVIWKDSKNYIINIIDTGVGISPSHLSQLNTPFFTTKSRQEGTGLGLSYCRSIIQDKFGGTLTISSTINVGTTCTLTFPKVVRSRTSLISSK